MFCGSKLPSVCRWEETTLDASYSVWPQALVSLWTSLCWNPVGSLPELERTAGFGWVRASVRLQDLRHSWTWSSNLYREQALDGAQIELLTWLVTLCWGMTWKYMRGFRAQTHREMLLWLHARCFNIQMQLLLKSTFLKLKMNLDGSFGSIWHAFLLHIKMYMVTERHSSTVNHRVASVAMFVWWNTNVAVADIKWTQCSRRWLGCSSKHEHEKWF